MNDQNSFADALAIFDLSVLDFKMILVCAVVFYLYTKIASKTLFGPLKDLHEAREKATVGAEDSATKQIEEAKKLENEYETQLTEARVAEMQVKLEKLAEVGKQASATVSKAEEVAREKITQARSTIEASREKLRAELTAEAEKMSDDLAAQLKQPPTQLAAHLSGKQTHGGKTS